MSTARLKAKRTSAAQTEMLPAESRSVRVVALAEIQFDTRQPRANDEEKAANVATIAETLIIENGVARPIHPVQIRPAPPWAPSFPEPRPHMTFDGECRALAAKSKGATSIECIDISIPEAEVFEKQVLTAMARKPLGPSALLNAVKVFDEQHPGINAVNAGARLGISAETVRALRKVNTLPPDVRLRYMAGEHTLEVCDSISRIEGVSAEERAQRQSKASQAVAKMTPREAKAHIVSVFLLRLATAPFDREDVELVPAAGPCSACQQRTGTQPSLFATADAAEDCCTKPSCWNEKTLASAAKNPTSEPEKSKGKTKKPAVVKPTTDDVTVAAALALGLGGLELDAKFPDRKPEDIDGSLERLAPANAKAAAALEDRRATGKDLGGYSCGSAFSLAAVALDAVRDAIGRLGDDDRAVFISSVSGQLATASGYNPHDAAIAALRVAIQDIDQAELDDFFRDVRLVCEPGAPPPPPPPVVAPPDDDYPGSFNDADLESIAVRGSSVDLYPEDQSNTDFEDDPFDGAGKDDTGIDV